jgi:hypothetical protein
VRTINTTLVDEYAEKLRPLLPLAARAYGTQGPTSSARQASDEVNQLLLEYVDQKGGNVTHLANALEGSISLPGLRRRLRSARARNGQLLGTKGTSRKRGSKDPEKVKKGAEIISNARHVSPTAYGEAVRDVYEMGVSLDAVGKQMDPPVSYYSLWVAGSHN